MSTTTFTTDTIRFDDFTVTELETALGGTFRAACFQSDDGTNHASVNVHQATGVEVRTFTSNRGTPSVTLKVAGELKTEFTMWGVTLDDLAAAVAAAQKGGE